MLVYILKRIAIVRTEKMARKLSIRPQQIKYKGETPYAETHEP